MMILDVLAMSLMMLCGFFVGYMWMPEMYGVKGKIIIGVLLASFLGWMFLLGG